jgi:regulator of sirC expression with transglutaminase-like and TPR domain
MAKGEALAAVWRWAEAAEAFALAAERAPGNPRAWAELAVARAAAGDDAGALAAAHRTLALVPRDADALRVQALALRGLGRLAAADAALAAYARHRPPDATTELRLRCAHDDPACRRERDPVHTHPLVPAE